MKTTFYLLLCLCLSSGLQAQFLDLDTADVDMPELSEAQMMEMFQAYKDSIQSTLTFFSDTTVSVGSGMAQLAIPAGYQFVGPEDAYTVLVDIWGNPPANGESSLGMLFPDKYPPASSEGYGIDIFHTKDGYIDDEDAADMDYDDLLEELQEDTRAANEARQEQGYETIDLIGWATAPHYDAANKRLHWAKELHFGGEEANTLNYNILFLGRSGYLTMNVIGEMKDLTEVNQDLTGILASVDYNPGHRYQDFDPSMDEVAAYGIGALVAGKVIAKTGLLAGLGIFLAKAWKILAIAGVAIVSFLRRLGGRGE